MLVLVSLLYKVPMDTVLAHVGDHRAYLATLHARGKLLASGPYQPRVGGALLLRVDDEAEIASILTRQLDHFQPEGKHARVEPGDNRYGKQIPSVRGIVLTATDVRAKLKFGTNRTVEHRQVIAEKLGERGTPLDLEAREHVIDRIERQRR